MKRSNINGDHNNLTGSATMTPNNCNSQPQLLGHEQKLMMMMHTVDVEQHKNPRAAAVTCEKKKRMMEKDSNRNGQHRNKNDTPPAMHDNDQSRGEQQ